MVFVNAYTIYHMNIQDFKRSGNNKSLLIYYIIQSTHQNQITKSKIIVKL